MCVYTYTYIPSHGLQVHMYTSSWDMAAKLVQFGSHSYTNDTSNYVHIQIELSDTKHDIIIDTHCHCTHEHAHTTLGTAQFTETERGGQIRNTIR